MEATRVTASQFRQERLKRRERRVGLAEDLSEEWVDAVRQAKAPEVARQPNQK